MSRRDDKTSEEARPALTRRELIGGAAGTLGLAAVAAAARPAVAAAQTAEGCFFALEIPEFFSGTFAHASGLGSETVLTDASSEGSRKVRGTTKWGDIVLKRGITPSMDLVAWRRLAEDGRVDDARKSGSIVLLDTAGSPVATYNFVNAWPSKVHVSSSEEAGGPCAWESITLAVDSVTRIR